MRFSIAALALGLISLASAKRSPQHVGKTLPEIRRSVAPQSRSAATKIEERAAPHLFLNNNTKKYAVNGSAIPDVDFDVGESYAGLLPISNRTNASELFFWFFPSTNPNATNEIVIWLNGGPGCSSLEGFLQENGPFLWQYGTFKPVRNQWSWTNLTNMVWVEQPVGTGFSQGTPTATSEADVASQFLGFFKNFVDLFSMQGYTVYIAGESYAGYYVPYIADAMFNEDDTEYYNISSIMIYDPSLSYDVVQEHIPVTAFADYWLPLLDLNATFMEQLHNMSDTCGYTSFLNDNLVFPPKGPLPTPPNVDLSADGCDTFDAVFFAASTVNPCFDIYQVATTCPLLFDVLGFPGSFDYLPEGASIYFNRTDVQKAIHAPIQEWAECTNVDVFVNNTDNSPPSALSVLPRVIERADRTIIGHGLLDMILIYNGTLLAIQNMSFNGAQGFSVPPSQFDDFYVPYHVEYDFQLGSTAGAGVMGQYHTERGLTLVTVQLSGHMIPQYAPSAAYRQLEFLLGRIPDLGTVGPFTTMQDTSY
ncbi:carboxypeptidase D [Cladophialophora yegresii CBS 114405]|uniref:Carboxypeptidase n=1 Tax=Cladophialophora yegresii CBS 114405 TaxID=1182544 RepID=W9W647_9EURO|nr:carboxypeptidase D [Cladophialophora yegresii CBS 114405]EXJ60001.1 carboxypeptidase D [Cladophialophora yegresii CBS 114405]